MKTFINETVTILEKDFLIEYRSRYAINSALAFVISSMLVVLFSLKIQNVPPTSKSGLIWIIILFAALSSLARSFVMETERKTYDVLRLTLSPSAVFVGKLIYNYTFTLLVTLVSFVAYLILADLSIASWAAIALAAFMGSLGISSVSTLLAAIISQANRKGAVFSVISLPLMLPLILILVKISKIGFVDGDLSLIYGEMLALIGFCGVMISVSIVLFDFIWEE